MRADINELRRMLSELMQGASHREPAPAPAHDIKALLPSATATAATAAEYAEGEVVSDDAPQTKADLQREQIMRALRRHNGRRREAAAELFMSERTLYRKIRELGIEDNREL